MKELMKEIGCCLAYILFGGMLTGLAAALLDRVSSF